MNNEDFKGTITKEASVPSMKSPDEAQPFKKSFDTPTALTGMYLWLLYVLFLMSTKSKILASITVLIILIIDQTIKIHIQYILKHHPERNIAHLNTIREYLYIVLVAVIIIGYIHYFIRARLEFGDKFNYNKFIFGTVHCFHHDYA